ncbi:MAG: hypothetical protein KAT35_02520, partial [Candidatus Aenigmarchaeota archaeon]|nr:hypothetical protein [Candidatus Aenigmarchaeota archaeon]
MRGTVDMAGLVLIAIGVLAIVVQVQNVGGDAYDALKLRTKANVFIEVNDQTGKFMPILNTRKGQLSHSEMFACMISGARFCGDDSLVEEITRDMNARLIVYDQDNKEIETYGKRDIGDKLFVDIPLPDGKRGRIAVIVERTREKGTIKDIVTAYGDCMKIVEVADSFIGCGYDLGAPRCSMPEKGTCL